MSDTKSHELIELEVQGMTCANCSMNLSKYLEKLGLENIYVNHASEEVTFTNPDVIDLTEILKGIKGFGYHVVDPLSHTEDHHGHDHSSDHQTKFWSLEKKFYISLVFTIPLFMHMFLKESILHQPLVQFILCLPVFLIGLFHFGKSAFYSLMRGIPNMDVLIFSGSTAAFIYSLIGWINNLGPNYLWFETTATIITLVLFGNLLEHRAVNKTTSSVRALVDLQKGKAKVVWNEAGREEIKEISIDKINTGQIIQLNDGDKIPVDGFVITGDADVDESMITGESVPVFKSKNSKLLAGCILRSGNLRMQAEKPARESSLAQIIDLVKKAQSDKPQIQKLSDQISAVFVPVVLGIALLTFVLSFFVFDITFQSSLLRSIAVLVVSCPCAMGLATPTAVTVGLGKAARDGILVKGAQTLETLAQADILVFDKTGTLTTGNFDVEEFKLYQPEIVDEQKAKSIIKGLEQFSSHPIAESLVRVYKDISAESLSDVTEIKGVGISGIDKNNINWKLGSRKISSSLPENYDLYLLQNNTPVAALIIKDELKPNTEDVMQSLHNFGYKTLLLSGDRESKTKTIAKNLAITTYYAEKSPAQKLEILKELSSNKKVAMIGDGINDAPSLSVADVGISFGKATQVAKLSADIVLLKDDIQSILTTIAVGKRTMKTIKQNLFWAFAYNIIAIPVAAFGYLNPMWGVLFMAMSDVVVIGNSLAMRIRKT